VFMKHSRPFWPVVMYPILEKLTPVSYDWCSSWSQTVNCHTLQSSPRWCFIVM
jgi:hypothetical protein